MAWGFESLRLRTIRKKCSYRFVTTLVRLWEISVTGLGKARRSPSVYISRILFGELAEWSIAAVLKTVGL